LDVANGNKSGLEEFWTEADRRTLSPTTPFRANCGVAGSYAINCFVRVADHSDNANFPQADLNEAAGAAADRPFVVV
jgi:hypothetical protein